jgi:hypothetical protein
MIHFLFIYELTKQPKGQSGNQNEIEENKQKS